jgi:hypothetical protein
LAAPADRPHQWSNQNRGERHIRLNLFDLKMRLSPAAPDDTQFWRERDTGVIPQAPAALHLGPMTFESGRGLDGRQHVANYTLDGVTLLGGDVSGTLDGGGAKVFLRWRPGE